MERLKRLFRKKQQKSPPEKAAVATAQIKPTQPPQAQPAQQAQPIFLPSATIASLPSASFPNPAYGTVTWKTLLSSPATPSNSLTTGLATLPAGSGFLALHRHEQAEVYLILQGEGVVSVGGTERAVAGGDVVFVPGRMEHGIRNAGGEGEELKFFYCFAVDGFDEVVYQFSGDE